MPKTWRKRKKARKLRGEGFVGVGVDNGKSSRLKHQSRSLKKSKKEKKKP